MKYQTYRDVKFRDLGTHFLIYWSRSCQSAANTIEEVKWMIDKELDYELEDDE